MLWIMNPSGWDALAAGAVAAGVGAALTPVRSRLAWRVGAVDEPSDRGLSDRPTPRLGGLAILAGVLVASVFWLPLGDGRWQGIVTGAVLITLVGALDDVFDLHPAVKLAGQCGAVLL